MAHHAQYLVNVPTCPNSRKHGKLLWGIGSWFFSSAHAECYRGAQRFILTPGWQPWCHGAGRDAETYPMSHVAIQKPSRCWFQLASSSVSHFHHFSSFCSHFLAKHRKNAKFLSSPTQPSTWTLLLPLLCSVCPFNCHGTCWRRTPPDISRRSPAFSNSHPSPWSWSAHKPGSTVLAGWPHKDMRVGRGLAARTGRWEIENSKMFCRLFWKTVEVWDFSRHHRRDQIDPDMRRFLPPLYNHQSQAFARVEKQWRPIDCTRPRTWWLWRFPPRISWTRCVLVESLSHAPFGKNRGAGSWYTIYHHRNLLLKGKKQSPLLIN